MTFKNRIIEESFGKYAVGAGLGLLAKSALGDSGDDMWNSGLDWLKAGDNDAGTPDVSKLKEIVTTSGDGRAIFSGNASDYSNSGSSVDTGDRGSDNVVFDKSGTSGTSGTSDSSGSANFNMSKPTTPITQDQNSTSSVVDNNFTKPQDTESRQYFQSRHTNK